MVYSTRRFVLCLTLCYFVLVFLVFLALRLPRLGKGELILLLFVRLFDLRLFGFAVSSSSLCLGRAAVCDCGTPWTFLLPFFSIKQKKKKKKKKKKKNDCAILNQFLCLSGLFGLICSLSLLLMVPCLFVLRFYGPVNPVGSCRARSVYVTTRLLDRLSSLSG